MAGTYLQLLLTARRKQLLHVPAGITDPLTLYRPIGNHGLISVRHLEVSLTRHGLPIEGFVMQCDDHLTGGV
jgi:hypothetical protein